MDDDLYERFIDELAQDTLEHERRIVDVANVIKHSLYERMMEIENKTAEVEADRAEIEAEKRLDERRERHFDRNGHFGPGRPDPGPD